MARQSNLTTSMFVTASAAITVQPADPALSQDWFQLPDDFETVSGRKGHKFRDTFTKLCMYLIDKAEPKIDESDYVIVASDTGNAEALGVFLVDCFPENGTPFGTQFATATTSACATNVNIKHKIRGGNLTLNAAHDSLFFALVAASSFLARNPESRVHLFFGNVFCPTDCRLGSNASPASGAQYLTLAKSGTVLIKLYPKPLKDEPDPRCVKLEGPDWFRVASAAIQSAFTTPSTAVSIECSQGSIRMAEKDR